PPQSAARPSDTHDQCQHLDQNAPVTDPQSNPSQRLTRPCLCNVRVNSLPGFAAEDKKAWRAFIEVQPHKWKRGGDKVDEHGFTLDADGHRIMEKDKPYWVEVVGLAGYYETGQNPGYETMAQAYAAAVKGISFWRCYKLGQGRTVPRDWWTSDTYMARGSIYRDDKPYYYDGDVPLFGL
ncbi:MAG TPA: hypothetical protein VLI39_07335, partial [Sedimentisphaerales bacterium]|nr:hypothetical protein [Sedimentisphaerales bacterium]